MISLPPPLGPNEYVTWVRVEEETFDIVGVLLTSLGFTGICVLIAGFLGVVLGAARIIRTHREREMLGERISIAPDLDGSGRVARLAEAEPPTS